MKSKILLYIAIAVALSACSEHKLESAAATATDTIAIADTTAVAKIIKTAEMRFKVRDVLKAKTAIGKTIKEWGGTVTEMSTNSYVSETEKVKFSADSLQEITSYVMQGVIVARVPSEKLDDFTDNIARQALFVDNQKLEFDDQRIRYLENSLKVRNRADVLDRINKRNYKKGDLQASLYVKDDLIDRRIENMVIDEKVKFSTITLNFYQDNAIKITRVANDRLSDYKPSFFRRLGLNIIDGWSLFKELVLVVAHLWMIILLVVAGYFAYRYYKKKRKK